MAKSKYLDKKQLTALGISILGGLLSGTSLDGVCNGFTNMWIQAVLTNEHAENTFYKRLDKIIENLDPSKNNIEVINKAAAFAAKINSIYQDRAKSKNKSALTPEELNLTEIKAFFDNVAIHQAPEVVHEVSHTKINQNDPKMYGLSASKQLESANKQIRERLTGTVSFKKSELDNYLRELEKSLQTHKPNQKTVFSLRSANHAVGLYYNSADKTWHYLNINNLKDGRPHVCISTKEVADLIFSGFSNKENDYTSFSIGYNDTEEHPALIENLKNINNQSLIPSMNHADNNGYNTFHLAVSEGQFATVKKLIQAGINVNSPTKEKRTPLIMAAQTGDLNIINYLLNAKANVNLSTQIGLTALMTAASSGRNEAAKILIQNGAKINAKTIRHATALSYACNAGYIEVVKTLLDAKADMNAKQIQGHTPLMLAIINGHTEIAKLLIERGANINLQAQNTLGALEYAMVKNNTTIVKLLLNHNVQKPSFFSKNFLSRTFNATVVVLGLACAASFIFGGPIWVGAVLGSLALLVAARSIYKHYNLCRVTNNYIKKIEKETQDETNNLSSLSSKTEVPNTIAPQINKSKINNTINPATPNPITPSKNSAPSGNSNTSNTSSSSSSSSTPSSNPSSSSKPNTSLRTRFFPSSKRPKK